MAKPKQRAKIDGLQICTVILAKTFTIMCIDVIQHNQNYIVLMILIPQLYLV